MCWSKPGGSSNSLPSVGTLQGFSGPESTWSLQKPCDWKNPSLKKTVSQMIFESEHKHGWWPFNWNSGWLMIPKCFSVKEPSTQHMKNMIETTNSKNPRDPREPRLNEVLSYVNPLFLTWEKDMTLSKCVEQPTENQPASGSKKFQRTTFQYFHLNTVSDEFSPKKTVMWAKRCLFGTERKASIVIISIICIIMMFWSAKHQWKKYIIPSTCLNITKRRYRSAACAFISSVLQIPIRSPWSCDTKKRYWIWTVEKSI